MFNKGILTRKQLDKIARLVYSDEERFIVNRLFNVSKKTVLYTQFQFLLDIIFAIVIFVLFVFIDQIYTLPQDVVFGVFIATIAFGAFYFFISSLKRDYYYNVYKRLTGSLLDNVLMFILDSYRISLAKDLPKFPKPKEFSSAFSNASLARANYYWGISQLIGISLGALLVFAFYISTGNLLYLGIVVVTIVVILAYGLLLTFGKKFSPKEQAFQKYSDRFDTEFKDSQPLLVRTGINLYNREYESKLDALVKLTTIINSINSVTRIALPLILLFIPYILGQTSASLVLVLVGIYVISVTFGNAMMITQKHTIDVADMRIKELDALLDTIFKVRAELTPDLYDQLKREYVKRKETVYTIDTLDRGNLTIQNLKYMVGREENRQEISLENIIFESGKVSFLSGRSGIGKSVFGRLLSLRYADFTADFLGIEGQDFRTFFSLEKGLSELHFSGLRHIETSYRQAMSSYLKPDIGHNLFVSRLDKYAGNLKNVKKHFELNKDYYGDKVELVDAVIADYSKDTSKYKTRLSDLSKGEMNELREAFRTKFESEISDHLLVLAFMTEFFAFAHMKIFIPEATTFFMDAVLSEPPISMGQRRRILFAFDILVDGAVLVVDEPFSNLDENTSKNILLSMVNYAKSNNSVVVALDQDLNRELLSVCRPEDIGKIMYFDEHDGQISIREENSF